MKIDPNQSAVDMYSVLHVGFGALCAKAGVGLVSTLGISLAFEWVLEPHYKERYPEIFPAPSQDSLANRVLDTVSVAVGWQLLKGKR